MLPSNLSFLPAKRKRPAPDMLPPDGPLLPAKRIRKTSELACSSVSNEIPVLQNTELIQNKRLEESERENNKK